MVNVRQGEVWWADLSEPIGSAPGYRRPVVVVQSDLFNDSALSTVVCVILTGNLRVSAAPGNVRLEPQQTGLPKTSVANITQLLTLDRTQLTERVSQLDAVVLRRILNGITFLLDA